MIERDSCPAHETNKEKDKELKDDKISSFSDLRFVLIGIERRAEIAREDGKCSLCAYQSWAELGNNGL